MTNELMRALVRAGEDRLLEIRARPNYSGRGMAGKETAAVVVENLSTLLVAVALAHNHLDTDDNGVVEEVQGLRMDNMGHDIVVY